MGTRSILEGETTLWSIKALQDGDCGVFLIGGSSMLLGLQVRKKYNKLFNGKMVINWCIMPLIITAHPM